MHFVKVLRSKLMVWLSVWPYYMILYPVHIWVQIINNTGTQRLTVICMHCHQFLLYSKKIYLNWKTFVTGLNIASMVHVHASRHCYNKLLDLLSYSLATMRAFYLCANFMFCVTAHVIAYTIFYELNATATISLKPSFLRPLA